MLNEPIRERAVGLYFFLTVWGVAYKISNVKIRCLSSA